VIRNIVLSVSILLFILIGFEEARGAQYPHCEGLPSLTNRVGIAANLQADAPIPGVFDPAYPEETSNYST
jgi:hypothetical protein